MKYAETSYLELKQECAHRGLGGAGTRDALVTKLVNDDLGQPKPEPEPKPKSKTGLKATDPNPDNPNYDMAGRWIRR